jgi:hypothetical protein
VCRGDVELATDSRAGKPKGADANRPGPYGDVSSNCETIGSDADFIEIGADARRVQHAEVPTNVGADEAD